MSLDRPTFQMVRHREGYDTEQVDLAVEMVLENLSLPQPRIYRSDIEGLRFMPVRMRAAYEMSSVDVWFDDAADELDLRHGATPEDRPSTGEDDVPTVATPSPTASAAIEEVDSGWARVLSIAAVVAVVLAGRPRREPAA